MPKPKPQRIDLDDAELDALVAKAATALTPQEHETLCQALETLRYITCELEKKRVSIQRLKAMLFGASSEKTRSPRLEELLKKAGQSVEPGQSAEPGQSSSGDAGAIAPDPATGETTSSSEPTPGQPKRKGHGRLGADAYTGGQHTDVSHPTLKPKDPCPKCLKGKVYRQKQPKVIVRLTGSAPVQAAVWKLEWFRCNLCGATFTAPLPQGAGPPEKYDASVTGTVGVMRYGYGMPFNRLANIQSLVRIPLPASTQWDLINKSIDCLAPVFTELIREGARGEVVHNDDTVARILELMGLRKAERDDADDKSSKRTGIFTTGLVSTIGSDRRVALYLTGRNHAGENLAAVLAECESGRPTLIQMSDALSRNEATHLPEGLAVILANCMSHARRKYVEIANKFPEQCLHVLVEIGKVYKNDADAKAQQMDPQQRLQHHQRHSRPIMDDLKSWLERQIQEKLVEPNSAFGEATSYMTKRWDRLTRFLEVAGAPIDNNICERALKRSIRHRKNSLFYKTLHGARVGDIYMSLIHTCELNGVNPFDYITTLLRQGEISADDAHLWMPWNYKESDGSPRDVA